MACESVLWCGPGHQSRAHCDKFGPHEIHHARHMGDDVYWRGGRPEEEDAFTGYFDESPLEFDE